MAYVNPQKKANAFGAFILLVSCVFLVACADNSLLNDLTGEPPPGVMANRAGILRVDSREAAWPNLARVPARPANVVPLAERVAQQAVLEKERQAGLALLPAATAPAVAAPAAAHAP